MDWCKGAIKSDDPAKAVVQISSSFCIKTPLSLVYRIKVVCTQKPHMDISILKIPWLLPSYLWIGILGDHIPSHPVPGLVLRLVPSCSTLRTNEEMQHFTCIVPESTLCFHNTSPSTAFHAACPVSALSPSRSTTTTKSQEHYRSWLQTIQEPLES